MSYGTNNTNGSTSANPADWVEPTVEPIYIINNFNKQLRKGTKKHRRQICSEHGMKYRKCYRLGLLERYENITPNYRTY